MRSNTISPYILHLCFCCEGPETGNIYKIYIKIMAAKLPAHDVMRIETDKKTVCQPKINRYTIFNDPEH